MNHKLLQVAAVAMLAVSICHAEEKEDRFDFTIGGGFVVSSGYQDYIDDVYTANGYEDSTAYGWVDLYAGIEYRPFSQFGILAGCDLWVNGLEATGGTLDESIYINTIIIPSLYGQLYLTKSRLFYVNAGINFPIPNTESDFFDFESSSIGWGANVGVELFDFLRIEGGYSSVPVTVKSTASASAFFEEEDYDFGGPQLRLLLAF